MIALALLFVDFCSPVPQAFLCLFFGRSRHGFLSFRGLSGFGIFKRFFRLSGAHLFDSHAYLFYIFLRLFLSCLNVVSGRSWNPFLSFRGFHVCPTLNVFFGLFAAHLFSSYAYLFYMFLMLFSSFLKVVSWALTPKPGG